MSARKTIPAPAQGPQGERGKVGPQGPPGPQMARADVLAVVEDQFYEIRQRLDVQLVRTSELQAQIDLQHQEMIRLREQVELVHGLLKKLVSQDS